ncbi:glycerol uptake facilitator and related permeases [Candidatus Scalindua japonica]|uniref:Glycerol uptake facilitator and related permeases n=1 Tax=Candidatus Scalindua japonica TaxID=1284222 RepID=A0A286U193_9BACT|nr:aquaporin [Candidatus Scalindua japonica]GAX61904.1 glycerol uptake facilitator and related permeases [Candidatus Scalindua japonica]
MNKYNKYIAEFLGTLLVVFISAGAICAEHSVNLTGGQSIVPVWVITLFGIVIAAIVYATSYIAGSQINPAVTISHWATGRMYAGTALYYILSQLAGAVLAAYFLRILFPTAILKVHLGTCLLGNGVELWKAALIECVVTFLFVFTIFSTTVDKRLSKILSGVAIGLVYMFGVSISSTFSGGALNPARVFGPAVVSGHFDNHYIWWLGPVSGALAAGFLYGKVFKKKSD